MNEEEKKTIEKFIEKCYKYDESVEIKGISVGEEYRMLNTVCKALNLIEKLQKENEKALDEYMKWQKQELNQKDKIIDLMAETINNHDIDEDICKQMGQKANCNEFEDTEKCKECIKQFFINKAKR